MIPTTCITSIRDCRSSGFREGCKTSRRSEQDLAFVDALTACKPYGWILFYNSRQFVETGNELEALGGSGPVVALHERELDAKLLQGGGRLGGKPCIEACSLVAISR